MQFSSHLLLAGLAVAPLAAWAQTKSNPVCPAETACYNPGDGEDIVVPKGFKVEVFAKDLNMPTDIAFVGNKDRFQVVVLESGTGLPSRCNNNELVPGTPKFAPDNPFTPNLLIFDQDGNKISGPLAKPTAAGGGFQPDGPAIGLAFERDFKGGTLFATDSNQGVRGASGPNNSSRVLKISLPSGMVTPIITKLPTGDHPTEQIVVKDGWLYWSQGSTTNSGVTGHDNGSGANQHEIACQDITLSDSVFDSGDGDRQSGYSAHNQLRPGAKVPAFEGTQKGMCSGAILRARISNPQNTVEPVAWGFRGSSGKGAGNFCVGSSSVLKHLMPGMHIAFSPKTSRKDSGLPST